ncbi:hypothetical protein VKT23_009171 [Stygiomarasmius scandens]|uniref:C2H2-type domain-containing protein n=1 Tax=Marasmiellus scandens TaxID=2682957 RepID=A0ABR1JEK6_9AGAR
MDPPFPFQTMRPDENRRLGTGVDIISYDDNNCSIPIGSLTNAGANFGGNPFQDGHLPSDPFLTSYQQFSSEYSSQDENIRPSLSIYPSYGCSTHSPERPTLHHHGPRFSQQTEAISPGWIASGRDLPPSLDRLQIPDPTLSPCQVESGATSSSAISDSCLCFSRQRHDLGYNSPQGQTHLNVRHMNGELGNEIHRDPMPSDVSHEADGNALAVITTSVDQLSINPSSNGSQWQAFPYTMTQAADERSNASNISLYPHYEEKAIREAPRTSWASTSYLPNTVGNSDGKFQESMPDVVIPIHEAASLNEQQNIRPIVAGPALLEISDGRRKNKGKPMYTCKYCGATLTAKHNLTNHINSHFGIKNHQCRRCGSTFGTKHVLKRHYKSCSGVPKKPQRR